MRIAAYQFDVSGDIKNNLSMIRDAVEEATSKGADLIVFCECALTGYIKRDVTDPNELDKDLINKSINEISLMSVKYQINIITGSIAFDINCYNRAYMFTPDGKIDWYDKRALYGWDEEKFISGDKNGIFKIGGIKIGVRICFEVRFPEYFRELYIEHTDLDIVLFYDVSDNDDTERYELMMSHLKTRAVENVTPILSVNSIRPFQTAPTCFIDRSGRVISKCKRFDKEMLIIDLDNKDYDFGEKGRKIYSDSLLGLS